MKLISFSPFEFKTFYQFYELFMLYELYKVAAKLEMASRLPHIHQNDVL